MDRIRSQATSLQITLAVYLVLGLVLAGALVNGCASVRAADVPTLTQARAALSLAAASRGAALPLRETGRKAPDVPVSGRAIVVTAAYPAWPAAWVRYGPAACGPGGCGR